MQLSTTIQTVLSVFAGLGIFAAGVGYLVASFMRGKRDRTDGVISSSEQLVTFWKDQVAGFKDLSAAQDLKIQVLTNEVNQMKGQLAEKDKMIEKYLSILQNRNPEVDTFMKTMVAVAQEAQTFMIDNKKFQEIQQLALSEIKTFMESINKHLKDVDTDLKTEKLLNQL